MKEEKNISMRSYEYATAFNASIHYGNNHVYAMYSIQMSQKKKLKKRDEKAKEKTKR